MDVESKNRVGVIAIQGILFELCIEHPSCIVYLT